MLRVKGIENDNDKKKFYAGDWGIRVFRISPSKPTRVSSFHPSFESTMRTREVGFKEHGESVSHRQLEIALAELELKVRQRHGHLAIARQKFDSFVQDSGYECVNQGTRCQGDCRDTVS